MRQMWWRMRAWLERRTWLPVWDCDWCGRPGWNHFGLCHRCWRVDQAAGDRKLQWQRDALEDYWHRIGWKP
jgi:hypothetical protein